MTRYLVVFFALALASGCAWTTPVDCGSGDWQAVGYQDGLKGTPERLDKRRQACAGVGVEPEPSAFVTYDKGWNEGLARYCAPDNGFAQGRRGKEYHGVCVEDVEPAFLVAYGDGLRVREIERLHALSGPVPMVYTRFPSTGFGGYGTVIRF